MKLALAWIMVAAAACAPMEDEEVEASTAAATAWDCYAPQPGHPTPDEKTAFLRTAGISALKAERRYGVPASAILAMAAIEGGFGYTRTALYAQNSFGYKFVSTAGAGGRGKYTLTCQPSWDVGNDYIAFRSLEDGILFVAYKLANRADWANYKAPTDRYRAARLADPDADPTAAVDAWIDGIADAGYNYDPPTYKRTIKGAMKTHALYRFSASAIPGASATAP